MHQIPIPFTKKKKWSKAMHRCFSNGKSDNDQSGNKEVPEAETRGWRSKSWQRNTKWSINTVYATPLHATPSTATLHRNLAISIPFLIFYLGINKAGKFSYMQIRDFKFELEMFKELETEIDEDSPKEKGWRRPVEGFRCVNTRIYYLSFFYTWNNNAA